MMNFCRKALKKIKLFVLYWTRIVFVKNNFKVSFFHKVRSNLFGGFLADQYVLYDLKHNDKSEYLSEFDWYRSRYINEPFDFAFNNKVICAEMLMHYVRMPENYFIKNKGVLYDFRNGVREYEDVLAVLSDKGRLMIKPFALGKGNGVDMMEADANGMFSISGNICDEEDIKTFLTERHDYIVCEYMKQHEYAKRLYDKTVNTIRLITVRDVESHEAKILFAVQRIGRAETIPVDNGSKGGLVARIEPDTGRMSYARCLRDLNIYYFHPDSGAVIEGVEIPGWRTIKEEILRLCDKVPFMDIVAWDILVTEEGICVIEANTSSGVNILQLWGGQRQEELGEFFRYHNVIKN